MAISTPHTPSIQRSICFFCRISYLALLLLLFLSPRNVSAEASSDEAQSSGTNPLARIAGGTTINSAVPYFVWLENCGATKIWHDIALSAAHCSVRGDASIGIRARNENGSKARVERVKKHPLYNDETYDYDFSIIKLSGWFPDGLVELNRSESAPGEGDGLTILGFGGSETLQQGRVSYVHPSVCSSEWGKFGYEIREEIVLCAADSSGVDACKGDSGGPLMDGQVQVGVISSGSGCNGLLPTTYSRVSAAIGWIESQICDMSSNPPDYCARNDGNTPGWTRVRVDIKLDEYPEDIVWRVHRGSNIGPTVASGGSYDVENALESKFFVLPPGDYVFSIEDTSGFGDGLGGSGSYKLVEVNKEGRDKKTLVKGGGAFGELESTLFAVGPPTTPPPTISNTTAPTAKPSQAPATNTTSSPTIAPMSSPQPSLRPVAPSLSPSPSPSPVTPTPTAKETDPSDDESEEPSEPSEDETNEPTEQPVSTVSPTASPTPASETDEPTKSPVTDNPTAEPTESPEEPTEKRPEKPIDEKYDDEEEEQEDKEDDEPAEAPVSNGDRSLQEDDDEDETNAPEATEEPEQEATEAPTGSGDEATTGAPTLSPTEAPSDSPTDTSEGFESDDTLEPTASTSEQPTLESDEPEATAEPTTTQTEEPTIAPVALEESQEPSLPKEVSHAPTITAMPSTSPSVSVMPSDMPSLSMMPSDIPTLFSVPTTESPTSSPIATPSSSPSRLDTDTDLPTVVPSTSAKPTETSSASPSTSLSPTVSQLPTQAPSVTSAPTNTDAPNVTAAPTTSMAPNVTASPSATPTVVPSSEPTATPSEAPTVPLQRHLITVSMLIGSGAEDIEWGIYNVESGDKEFGYPRGWFDRDGFTVSTVILKTGTWEFMLSRASDTATAIVEFGILQQTTGRVEEIATLNLGDSNDPELTAVFSLD